MLPKKVKCQKEAKEFVTAEEERNLGYELIRNELNWVIKYSVFRQCIFAVYFTITFFPRGNFPEL